MNIKPFIYLSNHADNKLQLDDKLFAENSTPLYGNDHKMLNLSFDKAKYLITYCCPIVKG